MKPVYALFRVLPNGGSELIALYSTRNKAEDLLERLEEHRRRVSRIEAFILDALPGEDFWIDSTRNHALSSTVTDPLAPCLDQLKVVVDRWIRAFDRANQRKRIPKRHGSTSRRART